MKCPYCGSDKSKVINSRKNGSEAYPNKASKFDGVYRRRRCLTCWETYGTIEVLYGFGNNLYRKGYSDGAKAAADKLDIFHKELEDKQHEQ